MNMHAAPKPSDTTPENQHSIIKLSQPEHTPHGALPLRLNFHAYFFFFGASTMIIWRPSIFGICST